MSPQIIKQAFLLARNEATKSPINNRYCAILICRNKIVSCAYNTFKYNFVDGNTRRCVLCG